MMRFSDELLKRCRKVVDVVERDPAKMGQVKKAVLDLVVIGDLMSRIVLQSIYRVVFLTGPPKK